MANDCGVKVKVRENKQTGVVEAYYAAIDESYEVKVGEMHRNVFELP
jgi:transcription elongation factor Elf1